MADPKDIIKKINDGSLTYDEQLLLLSQVEQTIKEQKEKKDEQLQLKADYIVQAFNKIKSDLEQRINEIEVKEPIQGLKGDKGDKGDRGDDGYQGRDGKDGKDGINGVDGVDGVGVADAHIDFDGTLVITLTNGKEITAGDVIPLNIAEKLKIFYNTSASSSGGGGTIASQDADSVEITGGSINGATVGATTAAAVKGTVVTATTKFVSSYFDASGSGGGALRNASGTPQLQWGGGGGNNLTFDVAANLNPANSQIDISPTGTGTVRINPATLSSMNNVTIGATTPAAITGTTVTATTYAGGNVSDWNTAYGWGNHASAGYAVLNTAQTFTAAQRGGVTALTDGATITPDFAAANNYSVTLGGSRTLANPTNLVAGQSGIIKITQDATGSRTLAFGSYWKFSAGTAPTLTTTANAVDILAYYVDSSTTITARLLTDRK